MADFVAVLRKTISGLSDNTPEMREKVYDKARSTIEAKIAALNPQPPAAIIERQRKALDDAIAVVRADFEQPPVVEDDFDDIIASLDASEPMETPALPDVAEPEEYKPAGPLAALATPLPVRAAPAAAETVVEKPAEPTRPVIDEPVVANDAGRLDFDTPRERPSAETSRPVRPVQKKEARGGSKGLIAAALVALVVIAGGVYAFMQTGGDQPGSTGEQIAVTPPAEGPVTTAEELAETPATPEEAPEEEIAAVPPSADPEPAPTPPAATPADPAADPEKFTQRLMADGSEVDDGPAGGQPSIGEGTSVSAVATPGETPPPSTTPSAQNPAATPNGPTATGGEQPAIAVGQRAIFYEERTNSAQGSAEAGSIVWSVVQESPGGDLPPEAAIRAEATIPANDVRLRMTIRRNGDQTLPAGHIVEMIFLTPEGFEGGAISNVSRIAFKETEQAAGNPLMGIPAKIADGFFLIALSDAPNEMQANLQLLGQRNWIDIPIVYQSGRRALLSLEKGIPGERVFQETLEAWRQASSAG